MAIPRLRARAARTVKNVLAEAALQNAASPASVSAPVLDDARERGLTVRLATLADVEEVVAVQELANLASLSGIFGEAHPLPTARIAERWRRSFDISSVRIAVCCDRGRIVGVSQVQPPWLHSLQVVPECWGTGVGALLHEDAITALRASGERSGLARVFEGNLRARAFWVKHGWTLLPWPATLHTDPPHLRVLTYGVLLDASSRRYIHALTGRAILRLGFARGISEPGARSAPAVPPGGYGA